MAGETRLVMDFEPGNTSRFTSIEAGNPGTQAVVQQAIKRAGWGNYACKVSTFPGVYWNNYIRCLLTQLNSAELPGQEYFWAGSIYFPTGANQMTNSNLLWELHHPQSLYSLSGLGVAPHALTYNNGTLYCRLAAGFGNIGSGWTEWYPNNVLLPNVPMNQWIDIIINLKLSENTDGHVKWYVDPTGQGNFSQNSPAFQLTGVATHPWTNGVRNQPLYTEVGIYNNGGSGVTQNDTDEYYITGWRRELTFANALAQFGGSSGGGGTGGGGTGAGSRATLPIVPTHTLPAKMWGVGHSTYAAANDQPVGAYQTLVNALNMEVFRTHNWSEGTSGTQTTALKAMALAITGSPKIMAQFSVRPNPNGSANDPRTNYPNDIQANPSNGSPEAMATTVADWIAAGLDIGWVEPYNEPHNNFVGAGGGEQWKQAGADGANDRQCADWAAIYQKPTFQRLQAAGVAKPIAGLVIAGATRDYIWTETVRWLEPNLQISSSPRSDANYGFMNVISCHPYMTTDDPQSDINSLFYTGAPDSDDRSGLTAYCNALRSRLNANGASGVGMLFSEFALWGGGGAFDGGSLGALADAAFAVVCARMAGLWNLQAFIYHSLDTTNSDLIINDNGHTHSAYQRTLRYRVLQQIVSPFIRTYKKQLLPSESWATAPAQTPVGAANNPVRRLQMAAGLNNAETTIGVLVTNIDLTVDEPLTLDLPSGRAMTAAATYTVLRAGTTYSAGVDMGNLATGTIPGTGAGSITLSQTIGKGEAWLIEIPIDGGGVVTPPDPVKQINQGPWTTAVLWDASAIVVPPPPVPDPQTNTGPWTSVIAWDSEIEVPNPDPDPDPPPPTPTPTNSTPDHTWPRRRRRKRL